MRELSVIEMRNIVGGEAITVCAVMALMVAALIAVIAYKMFTTSKGSAQIPGGFKFTWA